VDVGLALAALLLGVFVGVPLGVVAALQRNRGADNLIRVVSLMGLSFPAFVSAVVLLLVFAIELRMFPVISAGTGSFKAWAQSLALPAINLGLINAAYITRVTRRPCWSAAGGLHPAASAKGVPGRALPAPAQRQPHARSWW
jgi:peptide/nickel transport system permease protein